MIILGHHNTDGFHIHASRNHLAYRYVPVAIGTLTTIWWGNIITTLGRMTPYISMAAPIQPAGRNSDRVARCLGPTYQIDVPFFKTKSVAKNRHWLLLIGMITRQVTMLVIIPLKATFIQIVASDNGWTIIVLPKVGYALVSIYATLIFAAIGMLIRLWNRETGLKWDPVSIADQLALVQTSNIFGMFQGLEFANAKKYTQQLRKLQFESLKLGYWKHPKDNTFWYGLALSGTFLTKS